MGRRDKFVPHRISSSRRCSLCSESPTWVKLDSIKAGARRRRPFSVASQLLALQTLLLVFVLAAAGATNVLIASNREAKTSTQEVTWVAKTVAANPTPALAGTTFTETFTETSTESFADSLGPSVRAVSPVLDTSGTIVALVAVGVKLSAIRTQVVNQLPFLATGLLVLLAIALAGGAGGRPVRGHLSRP